MYLKKMISAGSFALFMLAAATSAGAIDLYMPDTTAAQGETLYIPLWSSDLTDSNVYSYQFIMSYDSTFVNIVDVSNDGSITDVPPWLGPAWHIIDGEDSLRVASAGTEPLTGAGLFVLIGVEVLATAPSDSSIYLGLHDFVLNEGVPGASPDGGWLFIGAAGVEPIRGDGDGPVIVERLSPTSVRFELADADTHDSRLEIYDAFGRFVTSVRPAAADDAVAFTWEGKNAEGGIVSGGVYFYKLSSGEKQFSGKVCILK